MENVAGIEQIPVVGIAPQAGNRETMKSKLTTFFRRLRPPQRDETPGLQLPNDGGSVGSQNHGNVNILAQEDSAWASRRKSVSKGIKWYNVKDGRGRTLRGVFYVLVTCFLNFVLYYPAAFVYKFKGYDGFKIMFWVPFCVLYAFCIFLLLAFYYGAMHALHYDRILARWYRNLFVFMVISLVLGGVMYFISTSFTTNVQTEEGVYTAVDATPVDFTIVGYVFLYVLILQSLSLIGLFGFSVPKEISGALPGKQTMKKVFDASNAQKMQQLKELVDPFENTKDAMGVRISVGLTDTLAKDLENIARPSMSPEELDTFMKRVVAILYDIDITSRGVASADNEHAYKMLTRIRRIMSEQMDVREKMDALDQSEHDAIELLRTMGNDSSNYENVQKVIEQIHDARSDLIKTIARGPGQSNERTDPLP